MATLAPSGASVARDAVADAHAGAADDGDLAFKPEVHVRSALEPGLGQEALGVLVEHLVENLLADSLPRASP